MRRCGQKAVTCDPVRIKGREEEIRAPCYNAKEVAKILGYGSSGSLWAAVARGLVPEPDFYSGMYGKLGMWKKSVIDKLRGGND